MILRVSAALVISAIALSSLPCDAFPVSSSLYGKPEHDPESSKENRLDGIHLRIVTTEDPPFIKVRENSKSAIKPWREWSGWIPALIKEVSMQAGFTYSLQLSSSNNTFAYGASDKEVVQGKTRTRANGAKYSDINQGGYGDGPPDLHWAGAYITWKRLDSMHMTAPFHTAPLSLLVKSQIKPWYQQMFRVLDPFQPSLWTLFAAMGFISTFIFMFLEGNIKAGVFEGKLWHTRKRMRDGMWDTLYLSFITMSSTNSFQAKTKLGKTYTLTWGIICLVMFAAYTGKMAAWMGQPKVQLVPSAIQQFKRAESQYKACVLGGSAYAAYLKNSKRYHNIVQVPVTGGLGEMVKKFLDGSCDGIIERKMHLEYVQGNFGEDVLVTDFFLDGPQQLAVMVNPNKVYGVGAGVNVTARDLTDKLSYWITKNQASGKIARLYKFEVLRGIPLSAEFDDDMVALDVGDFAGLIIIYLVVVVVVVIVRFAKQGFQAFKYRHVKKTINDFLPVPSQTMQ